MTKNKVKHNNEYYKDRINLSKLDESIFRPKKENIKNKNYIPVMYFTFSGKEDRKLTLSGEESNEGYPSLDCEENNTYAKRTFYEVEGNYHYFIKRNARGTLLNPLDIYAEKDNKVLHGLSTIKYSEVPKKAFIHYINFLKTRNIAHLKNAEREAI